jgi:hypothetical protein
MPPSPKGVLITGYIFSAGLGFGLLTQLIKKHFFGRQPISRKKSKPFYLHRKPKVPLLCCIKLLQTLTAATSKYLF